MSRFTINDYRDAVKLRDKFQMSEREFWCGQVLVEAILRKALQDKESREWAMNEIIDSLDSLKECGATAGDPEVKRAIQVLRNAGLNFSADRILSEFAE